VVDYLSVRRSSSSAVFSFINVQVDSMSKTVRRDDVLLCYNKRANGVETNSQIRVDPTAQS
jgi:hypothetical protein